MSRRPSLRPRLRLRLSPVRRPWRSSSSATTNSRPTSPTAPPGHPDPPGDPSATVSVIVSSTGGHDVAAFQQTITFGPNTTSETISIPIFNDGQPRENDVDIPLTLSSPGAGATLGATMSANLVIHDDNPLPAPVTVISLEPVTIRFKVGKGKRAKTKSEKALSASV